VVDATVKGAVPVAILDTITPAVPKLPTLALPDTVKPVKVPTLVILGCAFVVTVPAVVDDAAPPLNVPMNVVAVIALLAKFIEIPELVYSVTLPVVAFAPIIYAVPVPGAVTLTKSATFAYETFRFATRVVLVTVNGAVPVATLEIKRLAVTVPALAKLPEVVLPVTVNEVKDPTLVIFGCAAVVTVPAVVALLALVAKVALATVPETLEPATEFATVAKFAKLAVPLSPPTKVVAYKAPLLVLATNAAFTVSAILPVNALPSKRYELPDV